MLQDTVCTLTRGAKQRNPLASHKMHLSQLFKVAAGTSGVGVKICSEVGAHLCSQQTLCLLIVLFDLSCETRGLDLMQDVSGLLNPLCVALFLTLSPTSLSFSMLLFLPFFLGHSSLFPFLSLSLHTLVSSL